jgi:hypothetical protein
MSLIIPVVPDGVKLKLARADEQVRSIVAAVQDYAATFASPALMLDGELDGSVFTLRLPPLPPLDSNVSVDIGECLHNLRSALDQTTYAMLQANIPNISGLTPKRREEYERTSQFPITDSPTQFAGQSARRQMRGLSGEAVSTIERFQPYFGGRDSVGDSLWCLRELSNTDKHRLVHPTQFATAGAHVEMHTYPLALPHHDEWKYGVVEPEGVVVTVTFDYPPETAAVSTLGGIAMALVSGSTLLGSIELVLPNLYNRTKEAVDAMALHCNAA